MLRFHGRAYAVLLTNSNRPELFRNAVKTASIHILHAHDHIPSVVEKCAVECDDMGACAVLHDVQFSDDVLADLYDECQCAATKLLPEQLLRTFSFASTCITLRAMMILVAGCMTLLTVPPFPAPSSFKIWKSSVFRSSWNSTPISRVSTATLLPGTCASAPLVAGAFAGAAIARPIGFLRFICLIGLSSPDMMAVLLVGCRRVDVASLTRLGLAWG